MGKDKIQSDEYTLYDKIEHAPHVKNVGDMVCDCRPPYVIGIHGNWGGISVDFSFIQRRRRIRDSECRPPLNGKGSSLVDFSSSDLSCARQRRTKKLEKNSITSEYYTEAGMDQNKPSLFRTGRDKGCPLKIGPLHEKWERHF